MRLSISHTFVRKDILMNKKKTASANTFTRSQRKASITGEQNK